MRFIKFLIITYLLTIISCSPSLGASWYAKSGGKSDGLSMYVTSIKVLDKDVNVNDPDYRATEGDSALNFARAKRFSIIVPYNVKTVDIDSFKVEAYEDYKKQKPLAFSLEIEGDSVPLVAGETVSVVLRVKDNAGKCKTEEKFISVTRELPEVVELKLSKLYVHDVEVKVEDVEKLKCEIPYSKGDVVTAGDIRATFKVGEEEKLLPVIVKDEQPKLMVGQEVEIAFSVEEKANLYKSFSSSVFCKRLEKASDEDEALVLEYLSVLDIDARSGLVRVSKDVTQISANDIVATFKDFGTLSVSLQEDVVKFDNAGNAELIIKVEGKKGQYSDWSKTVHAVREMQDNPDDNETPSEPEPEEPSEPEPPVLTNPIDENGQKKFNVKINVKREEIDPFDYYKEDTFFSASRFDGWILNMTSMTNDNVASYAFKEGQWSGTPLSCSGDDIGRGQMNHAWDLKYYKYKNQEERWQERGGYTSNIDEKETKRRERFIFFRFTGSASAGTHLDNSMFCVDTHTKFLFYYSDPASISTFGVPSDWRDYDEPDKGKHLHSDKPFYLTDPVGYVKEDGECVIYGWCQQHIRANNYRATVDQSYRRQATRSSGGKGYSPYRDVKIKTTKERIVEENPLYTAEKPVITKQSGALYLTIDDAIEAKLSVKVKPAPKDEELSFQWYKNATASKEGGEIIDGAITTEYTMEKKIIDVYCYCVVTNKNTKNGKSATTVSEPVKVRIAKSSEDLKIDAETPIIKKHPLSSKHSFVEGKSVKVSLSVEVANLKDKGTLSYQWFESANGGTENGTEIEGATDKAYKTELSTSGTKYYYCVVTNKNDKATGLKIVSVASAIAKIEIEQLFELTVSCIGEGSLTVFGGEDGTKTVKDGSEGKIRVKVGTDLVFIAKPNKGWEIEKWEGKATVSDTDTKTAYMKVNSGEDVSESVIVNFKKIKRQGKLGITQVMIQNLSLGGYGFNTWTSVTAGVLDYSYFDFDFSISFKDDNNVDFKSLFNWVSKQDDPKKSVYLYKDGISGKESKLYSSSTLAKTEEISFQNQNPTLKLSLWLLKSDNGRASAKKINKQIISDKGDLDAPKGDIEFEYDELKDCWRVKNIDFNIENVTLTYNKKFSLYRGQELPFAVTYDVDNAGNYAVGSVKVVYTLLWE